MRSNEFGFEVVVVGEKTMGEVVVMGVAVKVGVEDVEVVATEEAAFMVDENEMPDECHHIIQNIIYRLSFTVN